MLFNASQLERSEVPVLINVGHGLHFWADNDFRVVGEKIDLENSTIEMEDDGAPCPEPNSEEGQTGSIHAFWSDFVAGLQQMLVHVAGEVFE